MSKSRRNVRFQRRGSDARRLSVSSDVSDAQSDPGNAAKNDALANSKDDGNGASKPSTIPEEVS